MNLDCFLKRYLNILMNDKDDDVFETIKIITGGTTSTRIAKLLNFAVSQMSDAESYVEVGVFTGTTLCSANYRNLKTCIGIDKYDPYEVGKITGLAPSQVRDRCLYNIQSIGPGSRLIEKDFKAVTREEIEKPVAVSFIDGTHTYDEVMDNLTWLEPLLAERAILVFDDINYQEVTKAIFDWLALKGKTYDLLAYVKPYYQDDRYMSSLGERFMNNGVCVLRYHKNEDEICLILPEIRPPKGEPTSCC